MTTTEKPPTRRAEQFMTVAEVASMWRVSNMTVYRQIHAGTLQAIQVGRSFRVPQSAVRDFELTADTWAER